MSRDYIMSHQMINKNILNKKMTQNMIQNKKND